MSGTRRPTTGHDCPRCESGQGLGVVIRGVYDGVLFWRCEDCGHAWHYAGDPSERRRETAASYVHHINEAVRTARAFAEMSE